MIILVFLIYRFDDTKSASLYQISQIIDDDYLMYFRL